MKSFCKKHWKWLVPTLAAAAALIAAGSLYFLGFRITYDPTIITNWDAVSGCASWVSVGMSFAAILFAIWVPIRIAKRQDKVALFEKRLVCYNEVETLMGCAKLIRNCTEENDLLTSIRSCYQLLDGMTILEMKNKLIEKLNHTQLVLLSGESLFSNYNAPDAINLTMLLGNIMMNIRLDKINSKCLILSTRHTDMVKEFVEKCDEFMNTYQEDMAEEICLNK